MMAWFKRKDDSSNDTPARPGVIEFIPGAGLCIISRQALEGDYPVRWMTRREPRNPADTGWEFLSIADTPEYLNTKGNLVLANYNAACMIEPALISIYDFPTGTELKLDKRPPRIRIFDVKTDLEIPEDRFYVPPQHRA